MIKNFIKLSMLGINKYIIIFKNIFNFFIKYKKILYAFINDSIE